jgi:hypothetical protein
MRGPPELHGSGVKGRPPRYRASWRLTKPLRHDTDHACEVETAILRYGDQLHTAHARYGKTCHHRTTRRDRQPLEQDQLRLKRLNCESCSRNKHLERQSGLLRTGRPQELRGCRQAQHLAQVGQDALRRPVDSKRLRGRPPTAAPRARSTPTPDRRRERSRVIPSGRGSPWSLRRWPSGQPVPDRGRRLRKCRPAGPRAWRRRSSRRRSRVACSRRWRG